MIRFFVIMHSFFYIEYTVIILPMTYIIIRFNNMFYINILGKIQLQIIINMWIYIMFIFSRCYHFLFNILFFYTYCFCYFHFITQERYKRFFHTCTHISTYRGKWAIILYKVSAHILLDQIGSRWVLSVAW